MGLTSWTGPTLRKNDVAIAKNYLNSQELEALNRIVTVYLDFAELQAINRRPMRMTEWISKLDDFLKLSEREVLTHAGKISAESAKAHAEAAYDRWSELRSHDPHPVDAHFDAALSDTKTLARRRLPRASKST
jgi:hypothetical protein